jgi:2-hydroxychromene-2-carboxylate isomerase
VKLKLEFFYDYVSVYSYLANSQLDRFDEVEYRPMFLGAVMQATGNRPPGTVEAKGKYLSVDVDRWVERYAVEYHMNSVFPQNTLSALRLAIAAQKRGLFSAIHQPIFDAMFIHDQDLSDPEVLRATVNEAGVPADQLIDDISDQSIKDALKSNTEEALARGAFGAPTIFVGNEMYFGNDRFEFIEEALGTQATR